MRVAALVPAAGRGKRLGAKVPKIFLRVGGVPILIHTLKQLSSAFSFGDIVVAVDGAELKKTAKLLSHYRIPNVRVVEGGRTRAESVLLALGAAHPSCDWVLVHDAARPFPSRKLVRSVVRGALRTGAALCALPATATVKRVDPGKRVVLGTEDRDALFFAQTPQVFKRKLFERRYRMLGKRALSCTDDAALFDGSSVKVGVVPGESLNLKVTVPGDLELFKRYLNGRRRSS